jgi:hypothetical protein
VAKLSSDELTVSVDSSLLPRAERKHKIKQMRFMLIPTFGSSHYALIVDNLKNVKSPHTRAELK